jgi:polygalacturonase
MKRNIISRCNNFIFLLSVIILLPVCTLYSQEEHSVLDKAPARIEPIKAPFNMPQLKRPVFPDKTYNIKDFGAMEGGMFKNTEAIRKTIEAASKNGGGKIIVPAGKWLTGAIHLDNNINLYLEKGAELLFSQDPKDYLPVVFSRHEDQECYKYSSFVYANGKKNIAITGEGTLNGQGKPWWGNREQQMNAYKMLREMIQNNVPVEKRIFDGTKNDMLRPAFFQPMNCKNVLVEGVTFLYGAFWTITPTYCENVIVRKVKIVTEGEYGHTPNGDGVDPSSCKNILIEYCDMDTGDDCIAIKSGRDEDGQRVGKPTENLVARHNFFRSGHGGIVIGSETSGGIKNIYGHDCYCNGTDRALRIKTGRGRGAVVENLYFKNITASRIKFEAIHLNMLYTTKRLPTEPVSKRTPTFRNFNFENITCEYAEASGIELLGLPESMIDKISFKNIKIKSAKGINIQDSKNIKFENVSVIPDKGPLVTILDSKDISFNKLGVPEETGVAFKLDGSVTENIMVSNTDLSKVKAKEETGKDVKEGALKISTKK